MHSRRGSIFTLESVVACIIIAGFLIFLARSYVSEHENVDASRLAYDALRALDDRNMLRAYAMADDFASINSEISIPEYNHSVKICGTGGACSGPDPDADNIWTGSYFIAGGGVYSPREVRLYLWE